MRGVPARKQKSLRTRVLYIKSCSKTFLISKTQEKARRAYSIISRAMALSAPERLAATVSAEITPRTVR